MKAIIQRVFSKKEAPVHAPDAPVAISVVSSELTTGDIENYYFRIISDGLRRMLVPADSIEIKVRRAGKSSTGLIAFAGYVRVLKWDPALTPVLLQNMPVIDARIRKVADASVILEGTHFAGLWFQATSGVEGVPKALLGMPCELVHQAGGTSA
jgi:hypothetical protein